MNAVQPPNLYQPPPPPQKKRSGMPAWAWFLIIPGVLFFLFIVVLFAGLVFLGSAGPSTEVLSGQKVNAKDRAYLVEESIIEENEKIIWFYSAGLFSISEDGNIVTDRRVISYETYEDELLLDYAYFEDISAVEIIEQGSFFVDTTISIETTDDYTFFVIASSEGGRDKFFYDEIKKRVNPRPKE
jgi:hypothetical protein